MVGTCERRHELNRLFDKPPRRPRHTHPGCVQQYHPPCGSAVGGIAEQSRGGVRHHVPAGEHSAHRCFCDEPVSRRPTVQYGVV